MLDASWPEEEAPLEEDLPLEEDDEEEEDDDDDDSDDDRIWSALAAEDFFEDEEDLP